VTRKDSLTPINIRLCSSWVGAVEIRLHGEGIDEADDVVLPQTVYLLQDLAGEVRRTGHGFVPVSPWVTQIGRQCGLAQTRRRRRRRPGRERTRATWQSSCGRSCSFGVVRMGQASRWRHCLIEGGSDLGRHAEHAHHEPGRPTRTVPTLHGICKTPFEPWRPSAGSRAPDAAETEVRRPRFDHLRLSRGRPVAQAVVGGAQVRTAFDDHAGDVRTGFPRGRK